jgi:hypothetical protein
MHKPFTLIVKVAAGLAAMLFGAACTFTTTIPKPPVYGEPLDSLRAQVRELVVCEHFDIDGEEITINGKKRAELSITVVNGRAHPGMDKWELGKALGGVVKRSLRDTAEYQWYTIRFSSEVKNGLSFSKESISKEFPSKDL